MVFLHVIKGPAPGKRFGFEGAGRLSFWPAGFFQAAALLRARGLGQAFWLRQSARTATCLSESDGPAFFKQLLHSAQRFRQCAAQLIIWWPHNKNYAASINNRYIIFQLTNFHKKKSFWSEQTSWKKYIHSISVKSSVKVGMYWYRLQTTDYLYSYVTVNSETPHRPNIWEVQ